MQGLLWNVIWNNHTFFVYNFLVLFFFYLHDLLEFRYCYSLIYEKWWCCYSNILYFFEQVCDDLHLFFLWNMIEFSSKYIEINIEYWVLTWHIIHIGIKLILILYTYHISNESRLDRREYIVPNIAGMISKIPGIFCIFYCLL